MQKLFLTIFLLFSVISGYADIPKLLHYQGNLTDGQGIVLDGQHKLTFRIYDAEIQGNFLWKQDFNAVEIAKGNFAVLLDVGTASSALTFNQAYWLSIEVDDDGEMSPRQQIASSAYSINAGTVNGIQASTTVQANNLLPLNAQGKFSQEVLDIQQGSGGNFNADTVDGFHAATTPTANTLLPLDSSAKISLSAIPQDQGSGLNADKVDGKEASQLLDRTQHTGVQPPATISPQGSGSGLDADKVDGLDATQINADKVDGYDANAFLFPAIYSYGTGESSPTSINQSQMKMAFGRITINGSSTVTITGLPFSSSSTFEVVCSNDDNDGNLGKAQCRPTGGSTAGIYNVHPDPRVLHWMAIGY